MGVADTRVEILNASLTPYSLPLTKRWHSHSHSLQTRQGYLLQLEGKSGIIGYGDCAPLPSHGTETAAESLETLNSITPNLLNSLAPDVLNKLPDMASTPAARCALESALLDLITKKQATPLHKWMNSQSKSAIKVNASVGALNEGLNDRIAAAIGQGYLLLKLKVGVSAATQELDLLNLLCSNLPDQAMLRLDANRAWDFATAQDFLHEIRQMPIESVEEPLFQPDTNLLQQLQDATHITLALDESVAELKIADLSLLQPLHRIILKPMVLGGALPALHLGQRAHSLGIETVVTSTIDSAAGVWAATQLAAALDPERKLHHGVATSDWLEQDLGKGPNSKNGCITLPQTPGSGFVPYD